MPPPAQSQGGSQPESAYGPVWITALALIVTASVWYAFHEYIVAFIFRIKLFEANLVSLFTTALNSVIVQLQTESPGTTPFGDVIKLSTEVGNYIRYPLMAILAIFAAILYANDVTKRYRRTYQMKDLLNAEYVNWPNVTPVLKLNLIHQNIDEGPWAGSTSPRAFAEKNKLLKRDLTERKATLRRERGFVYGTINKGEAKRIFTMQLGEYWTGPDNLPCHTKALFAIFSAKINRDRDAVTKMLAQLSSSIETGKIDYSGIDALLNKHKNTEDVLKVCRHHAYTLTVMASLLQRAREDGVLCSAQFLWLKPIDRRLWYMLNSVGRQTPFAEVSGAFAHWLAEKELKHSCLVPMVDEAVNALDAAIKEIKFKEEELPA